jgi:outer membrane lipoprotein-sorting protein
MKKFRIKALLLSILPFLTTGCFVTKRKIPQARPPATILNAKADQLVARINEQYDSVQTLKAKVQIQYSSINRAKGEQNDVTPFPTNILMRKPAMLRVLGQLPVVHTRAFDLASDGDNFKLLIPPRNEAFEGLNTVTNPSPNPIKNLRPAIFLDSLLIRRINPDDLYTETATTKTVVDEKRKSLLEVPEYELSIFERKSGGNELTPVRVVSFHREDLLPYQQDIYDDHGNLETQVTYDDYRVFGSTKFPGTIVIARPLQSLQITMTIDTLTLNEPIEDNNFRLEFPKDVPVTIEK